MALLDDTYSYLLRDEVVRLESFQNWPVPHIVTPASLASAGFYYLKEGDHTQCAYCNGIVGRWEAGDVPDREHVRHFPLCPFVQTVIRPRLELLGVKDIQNTGTTYDLTNNLEELGINVHKSPKYSRFATTDARLQSFRGWPEDSNQDPYKLAEAGFYYCGITDHVFCFSCGGGIFNWEPADEPWTEHAKWYPKCNYVLLVKGEDFVNKVAGKVAVGEDRSSEGTTETKGHYSNTSSRDSKSLEEENRLLKDARLCKICMDKEISIIFLPCRHLVACEKCAPSLQTCPVCRSSIKATIKTYLS